MDTENMKNMIVLKNLPSNIVDEAIVILKPNVKLKSLNTSEKGCKNKQNKEVACKNPKKYIINEAEMVISNYLSKLEKDKTNVNKINKKMETKYKRVRGISIILGILFLGTFFVK